MQEIDTKETQENNQQNSRLFFPEREEIPVYELPENFEDILGISEDLYKREQASIESLLFSDNKKIGRESSRDLFDKKEKKMLEDERERYVDYLCEKFEGLMPDILCDKELFDQEYSKNKKSRSRKNKEKDGEEGDEEDGEQEKEGENFMTDEEEEEEDDYNVNAYEGEDDIQDD